MLAKSKTCAVVGLDGYLVEVEVDISPGLPSFTIVGLPDAAVQEARERVRAAIRNSGCEFPMRRITVNLAPADLRKAGPAYDLPIAVAILLSSRQVPSLPESSLFLGELSLDGGLKHTNGMLPMVAVAKDAGIQTVFVPLPDAREAALVEGVEVVPVEDLARLVAHLRGPDRIEPVPPGGTGVDGLAEPEARTGGSSPLIGERPFRAPHHTISNAGLAGGGRQPRPGEITLSHRGVLFLDELPEFGHTVLEVLRQPIEDKIVTISRAQGTVTFPANFMLVAAMNPCACGFYGDPVKECTCTPGAVARYKKRISGPLLDRIDLFVEVPRIEYEKLMQRDGAEASAQIRERTEAARGAQRHRFEGTSMITNAEMGPVGVWGLLPCG
jgi:magnesium chelatase family protein